VTERLDKYLCSASDLDLGKLVGFAKDWNSNARTCFVAQTLINAIFRLVPTDRLVKLKALSEASDALLSYSERHYDRLNRLEQASYLLEYMSSLMVLLPLEEGSEEGRGMLSSLRGGVHVKRSFGAIFEDEDDQFVPMIFSGSFSGNEDARSEAESEDSLDSVASSSDEGRGESISSLEPHPARQGKAKKGKAKTLAAKKSGAGLSDTPKKKNKLAKKIRV
jgi:hypothetical protein